MTKYILTVIFDDKNQVAITSQTYHFDYEIHVINTIDKLKKDLGHLFTIRYSFVEV